MSVSTIVVTEDDIKNGKPLCRHRCPIVLAANRAFGMSEGCEYGDGLDGWELERYEQRYDVVGGAEFALDFDRQIPVQPRTFKLRQLHDAEDE